MDSLKEVARYCAEHIVDWDAKCQLALTCIGSRMTIPNWFRNEILDKVEEWCNDNEVSLDFFDDSEEIAEDILMTEI